MLLRTWWAASSTDSEGATSGPEAAGMAAAAREIAQNGWRGFYVGFLPCIMRAVPANAACFVAFETIMNILPPYVIARRYHRLVGMN